MTARLTDQKPEANRRARAKKPRDAQKYNEYMRQWYAKNRERVSAQARARFAANPGPRLKSRATYVAQHRVDIRALKLLRGCIDCGYAVNADALQFDHLPGMTKRNCVSSLAGSPTALIAEIEKCEVVCANCHAIRTARRAVPGDGL